MADKKISELTALTAPDGAEELVVNDGGTSKKITIDNIFNKSIDVTGTVTADGLTVDGNLNFTNGALTINSGAADNSLNLDASANVMLGNTIVNPASGFSNQRGFGYDNSTGETQIASTSTTPALQLGKNNATDGDILVFRKESTTVGSIGTHATGTYIYAGAGDTGIVFAPNIDTIIPYNTSTNNYRDNAIDIGSSSYRFKDLYLSGGVYLGGTGAANKLDDYEEGTWDPVLRLGGSGGTDNTNTVMHADYTKIGNLVYINVSVTMVNTILGSGHLIMSGLPFASSSSSQLSWRVNDNMDMSNAACQATGSEIQFYKTSASTTGSLAYFTDTSINSTAAGKYVLVSGTYRV